MAIQANLRLVNLFTEPIQTKVILEKFFPEKRVGDNPSREMHYGAGTVNANCWGKEGRYIYNQEAILEKMSNFIKNEKSKQNKEEKIDCLCKK